MKIEIITTGDEILQGIIVDTNTAWIAERCWMLGHEVIHHTAVGDNEEAIGNAMKTAVGRADCVIVSGGLGPTVDDITVEAASKAFQIKLNLDETVLTEITKFFERVGRPMAKSNEKQAMIPEGGRALPNHVGTAPGIQVKLGNAECFFLPGVPRELYQIFDESITPWLHQRSQGACESHILRCFGLPEATIDEQLKGVDFSSVRLSFRVKYPEILLKLIARCENTAEAREHIDAAVHVIRERLGDVVYGEGETGMPEVVGKMLRDRQMTLAVAESCTGGLIASMFTDIAGSSEYFERGIVSYSNLSKQEMLGVSPEILRANGAVSRETALAMAEGVRRISKTSIGISTTGIAGPAGGSPEKPIGTVHMAYVASDKTEAFEYHFSGDRERLKQIFSMTAINMVRKCLI
jgi:nicotinamide-nucleotide amidase